MKRLNKSEKIADAIAQQIRSGVLTDKLPSEQTIAKEYDTARMTAGKALNILVARNLAERIPFKGTYVKKIRHRTVRTMGQPEFVRHLAEYVSRNFPGVSMVPVSSVDEAELMVLTTFTPFEYETRLRPLPRELVERVEKSGQYYPMAVNLHRRGKDCYGIPAMFSPFLMAYDKKIMRELDPGFEPYELSLEKLLELKKRARTSGVRLIGRREGMEALFYSILYDLSETPGQPEFQKAFELFDAVTGDDDLPRFLFQMVTRHSMAQIQEREPGVFDVAPMPELNGRRCCSLASEALFVNRDADDFELLFELCEATLSPEFQRTFNLTRRAIPIHRGCALDSIGATRYRDDFFFAEVDHLYSEPVPLPFAVRREVRFAFRRSGESKVILAETDKANIFHAFDHELNEQKRNRLMLDQTHYYT